MIGWQLACKLLGYIFLLGFAIQSNYIGLEVSELSTFCSFHLFCWEVGEKFVKTASASLFKWVSGQEKGKMQQILLVAQKILICILTHWVCLLYSK